ncbi:hypothetical protein ASJ81_15640 [Methanosarcina spelaei]|uniref:Uncharacterized protein n=1 Tax=Methanosarcina spelaei TaxID=1036679 RepID=A0A2A2HX17_9EURY|nr:hypothetical protein ASJ81_15640 [Methanosarcina spelaei]
MLFEEFHVRFMYKAYFEDLKLASKIFNLLISTFCNFFLQLFFRFITGLIIKLQVVCILIFKFPYLFLIKYRLSKYILNKNKITIANFL